jgi:hypothetical protein
MPAWRNGAYFISNMCLIAPQNSVVLTSPFSYRVFRLKRNSQHNETNGDTECLQPCFLVAAGALLEIGTAVVSAVCRSMSTCHRQTAHVSLNIVTGLSLSLDLFLRQDTHC